MISILIALGIIFLISGFGVIYTHFKMSYLNKRLERNNEVYSLRIWILMHLPHDAFKQLPSYDEMFDSEKPIKIEHWLKNYKS